VVSVRFMPYAPELAGTGTSYTLGPDSRGYWSPNLDLIRATVQTVLNSPPEEVLEDLDLPSLEEECRPAEG